MIGETAQKKMHYITYFMVWTLWCPRRAFFEANDWGQRKHWNGMLGGTASGLGVTNGGAGVADGGLGDTSGGASSNAGEVTK